jgi:hypothetical protein
MEDKMNNTFLSIMLIPTFLLLYIGGIIGSTVICSGGIAIMSLIVAIVLLQKKIEAKR